MNAVTTQSHKTHSFKWLLKREYWENRGGFLWAPVITGGIIAFITTSGTLDKKSEEVRRYINARCDFMCGTA